MDAHRWMRGAACLLFLMGIAGGLTAQTANGAQPPADHPAEKSASDPNAGCAACHADIAKQYDATAAAHAKNGVTCASCHPAAGEHAVSGAGAGTTRRKPETVAEVNEGCASCHAAVAANFTHPHPVIEVEGCVSCHAAHGSANADMLTKTDTSAICAQCHLPAHAKGGPGAAAGQAGQATACTSCHTEIHGSNTSEVLIR
ncbi:MAG: cytochrome c3 family protein [Acidobacteriaceae bacterium]